MLSESEWIKRTRAKRTLYDITLLSWLCRDTGGLDKRTFPSDCGGDGGFILLGDAGRVSRNVEHKLKIRIIYQFQKIKRNDFDGSSHFETNRLYCIVVTKGFYDMLKV